MAFARSAVGSAVARSDDYVSTSGKDCRKCVLATARANDANGRHASARPLCAIELRTAGITAHIDGGFDHAFVAVSRRGDGSAEIHVLLSTRANTRVCDRNAGQLGDQGEIVTGGLREVVDGLGAGYIDLPPG